MITDTQIKTFLAPILQEVRSKGMRVMFMSSGEVVLANQTHGISSGVDKILINKNIVTDLILCKSSRSYKH